MTLSKFIINRKSSLVWWSRNRKILIKNKSDFFAILPPVKGFKNIWNKFSWKHHLLYRLASFSTQIFSRKGCFDPYCPRQNFLNDKKTFQQPLQNIWQHFSTARVAKCHRYHKCMGVKKLISWGLEFGRKHSFVKSVRLGEDLLTDVKCCVHTSCIW